jgi:hypothetical protein
MSTTLAMTIEELPGQDPLVRVAPCLTVAPAVVAAGQQPGLHLGIAALFVKHGDCHPHQSMRHVVDRKLASEAEATGAVVDTFCWSADSCNHHWLPTGPTPGVLPAPLTPWVTLPVPTPSPGLLPKAPAPGVSRQQQGSGITGGGRNRWPCSIHPGRESCDVAFTSQLCLLQQQAILSSICSCLLGAHAQPSTVLWHSLSAHLQVEPRVIAPAVVIPVVATVLLGLLLLR